MPSPRRDGRRSSDDGEATIPDHLDLPTGRASSPARGLPPEAADEVSTDLRSAEAAARTLIPDWGEAPGPINLTTQILGATTVAAGAYLRAEDLSYLNNFTYDETFVNHGVLWHEARVMGPTALVNATVTNTGRIVSLYDGEQSSNAYGVVTRRDMTNSGDVFAVNFNGVATSVRTGYDITIDNSGLLAAWSGTHFAVGVDCDAHARVVNGANGRILAEGVGANAIQIGSGLRPQYDAVAVDNDGLIEARSHSGAWASTGIFIEQLSSEMVRINNSGVIRADYAIFSNDYGAATVVQTGVEHVTNLSGGLIEGAIHLGRGDDVLVNDGLIRGEVAMGEGADHVDNRNGVIDGVAFLFWGDDQYQGGAGVDRASGDNGDDYLEGGGGADLLLGGGNDDVLIGGAGADGLYGEYGDDRIVTQGGDRVFGGAGDDRIELGDYAFGMVSGGSGFDTLVLPTGARGIELRAVLSLGRVDSIEQLILGGGKSLAIRAGDIAGLTGAPTGSLRVQAVSSDRIELVGAWAARGQTTLDGIVWNRFELNGEVVLVQAGATAVVVSAPSAGLGGLDAVPGGPLAPTPGPDQGVTETPTELYLLRYELSGDVTINPEETWYNDGLDCILWTQSSDWTLTNHGALITESGWNFPVVTAVLALNGISVINEGLISSVWYWDDNYTVREEEAAGFVRTLINAGVVNTGRIEALTLHGQAIAAAEGAMYNEGEIFAWSQYGYAIGLEDPFRVANTGVISVEGRLGAVGMQITSLWEDWVSNAGYIEAISAQADSVGVQLMLRMAGRFENSGVISADIAVAMEESVYVPGAALTLANSGLLDGRVHLGSHADHIINSGEIAGAVNMGAGNDEFDGSEGWQGGLVDGQAGDDVLRGGAADDHLAGGVGDDALHGGEGNDLIDGGLGTDTFHVSGAPSQYVLLQDGDDFILKGADGRDHLTGVELVRFGDGTVWDLARMYARNGPQILPDPEQTGGKAVNDYPLILPADAGMITSPPTSFDPLTGSIARQAPENPGVIAGQEPLPFSGHDGWLF